MLRHLMIGFICVLFAQTVALAQAKEPAAKEPSTKPTAPTSFPSLPNAAVSIPWDELRQLIDRGAGEKAEKPPVDFVFSPATYTAAVGEKGVSVIAETAVTLLRDGWVLVPLGPSDAGVTKVTADGEAAPVVVRDGGLFALLSGGGKKKLVVSAERQTIAEGGRTRFEQPLLPAALVTLTATVPGTALDVQANGASSSEVTEEKNQTSITAAYRGGAIASIAWKQRPIALKEADARVSADTQTLVTIEKGLMRSEAHVHVTIERAPIRSVQINIDPKAVVLSVSGKDVGRWTEAVAAAAAKDAGAARTVNIEFGSAVEGERTIEIVYERDVPEEGGDVQIAPVIVKNARRDRGTVSVATRGGYDIRPGDAGTAERVSVSELPEWLRTVGKDVTVQVGYRYAVAGANVTLTLEKEKQQEAKVFALTSTRIAVERGVLRCRAEVTYEILHAGIDTLRVGLPDGAEVEHTTGASIRNTQVIEEKNNVRTLVVGLKDLAKDKYQLTIDYNVRFEEAAQGKEGKKPAKEDAKANAPAEPAAVRALQRITLITNPDASQDRGFVGIEVRGGYELTPDVEGAERVDVKELPQDLWQMARSPLMFGYRYDTKNATITLSMLRHQDVDVLIAMSDICEATTTFTPDGKSITKMMLVTRNNLKPFMTLKLPEGAQLWSAFVDDRPVTPTTGKGGTVLIPLKKSEDVDDDDQESYKAKREERRMDSGEQRARLQQARQARAADQEEVRDLKPYDIEIVFVMPAVKFEERGDIKAALPQSDVPIGQLSWAICLPKNLRVLEADGNLSEVAKFTLPFRHFADSQQMRQLAQADAAKAQQQQAAQAAQELASAQEMADAAKAKGVLPVRIEIPVVGEIHRFEKFLTVDEAPQLSLLYSRKLME